MSIVIYAEKPDVARKIAAAIGPIIFDDGTKCTYDKLATYEKRIKGAYTKQGYIPIKWKGKETFVTWGYGHLCGLYDLVDYDKDLKNWRNIDTPYIPKKYKLKTRKEVRPQFNVCKKLFNEADLIINATDWDREGEIIFAYLYEAANCKKPFKRAYYVSQNEQAFNEAFGKLVDSKDVYNMEQAGRMRSIADWLVGINLTVDNTLRSNTLMSIGRVQTPTLAMLVDREKKIREFKSETYYVPQATFTTKNKETYNGEYSVKGRITDKSEGQKIIDKLTGNAAIKSATKKDKKVASPPLYSLGTLQMDANSKFGFSASKTLDVVQSLYEAGVITYPRTNSAYLPEDYRPIATKSLNAISSLKEYEKFLKGKAIKFNGKYFNDSKVESHFAIVPTHVTPTSLSKDQEKLYDLICRSLIVTIYPDAIVEDTKLVTVDNNVEFNTKGSIVKTPGWMEVIPSTKDTILPSVKEKENVKGEYELAEKETGPPKRYTDKTLIAAMISADMNSDEKDVKTLAELNVSGIGTEATRANIIETLINRGYVEREKKAFRATDKGITLIDTLPIEDLKSASLTAQWETRLDSIAKGKEKPEKFQRDIEKQVGIWCNTLKKEGKVKTASFQRTETEWKCPVCGEAVITTKWGYGCEGYKKGCKFAIFEKVAGKKLTKANVEALLTKGETGLIKGFTSKAGKKFNAKLYLDDNNKVSFKFE